MFGTLESKARYLNTFVVSTLLILLGTLSGCSVFRASQPTLTPTPPLGTATPTVTPTPPPLGDSANPLVMAFVSESGEPGAASAADQLASQLSQKTGLSLRSVVFKNYNDLLDGMAAGNVHAAWLPPLTYLWASQNGYARVSLLTNHFGVYQYGAQFLANRASDFTAYFDAVRNQNTADAAAALPQFQDKRPCWVDLRSASGYLLPFGLLKEMNLRVPDGVLTQGHTATIRALYVRGICDYGVTFAMSGDPRTSPAVLDDLPDAMERVAVLWQTDAVIPNTSLSYLLTVPQDLQNVVNSVLMELVKTPEGRQVLSTANSYEIDELKLVDDTIFERLRALVNLTGVELKTLIGR